jgi:hypothetical protein
MKHTSIIIENNIDNGVSGDCYIQLENKGIKYVKFLKEGSSILCADGKFHKIKSISVLTVKTYSKINKNFTFDNSELILSEKKFIKKSK